MNDENKNQNNLNSVNPDLPNTVITPENPTNNVVVTQAQENTNLFKKFLTNKKLLIIGMASVIALSGVGTTFAMYQSNQTKKKTEQAAQANENKEPNQEKTDTESNDFQKDTNPKDTSGLFGSEKKTETPAEQPKTTTEQPTTKTTAATNCLPANPTQYQTTQTGKYTSEYLQTNSYGDTAKLYSALQFAGLIDKVNKNQVVVFAPTDSIFTNKITPTQLAWMNQSPENMKSVLGWQIVIGCITWDGVNPVKDKEAGATVTLNTLNGPVTYTHGGQGKVENAQIAIWDWFTSNGSVTFITDFIKPPQVP
jgi:hypothetical protein